MILQADHSNRGYYPFGMGSAKNAFSQDDRKEAFNVYGGSFTPPPTLHRKRYAAGWYREWVAYLGCAQG